MNWTSDINQFVEVLQNGGVGIFPTDTVWGIGCSADSVEAIKKLYQIKKREADKPTAILVGSVEQAMQYGELNPRALQLSKVHWPGALTIIVPAKETVPTEVRGKNNTVGIRFPDYPLVHNIALELQCGIMTGSANFSGGNPPLSKTEIDAELIELVDICLDGECGHQPPSTIIDCTTDTMNLLRQGSIILD